MQQCRRATCALAPQSDAGWVTAEGMDYLNITGKMPPPAAMHPHSTHLFHKLQCLLLIQQSIITAGTLLFDQPCQRGKAEHA